MAEQVYMYPAGHAGVALYTYNLANALASKGLRVTLFCDDKYELDDLPAKFVKANVLSSKYEGIRQNKSTMPRILGIIGAHSYNSFKFYSYVKKDAPEIVHLHSFFFYPIEWCLLNRLAKSNYRVILTVHNAVPYNFYIKCCPRLELAILQYLYDMADKLIVHTEMNKRQLLANFSIDRDKVAVIPHGEYCLERMSGQRTSEREARARLKVGKSQRVILFFGYIRKIKGIDVLLRAFDQVAETCGDIVLVIAGSVIEDQSFRPYYEMVRRMKHGNRVRCFIQYIEHKDIPTFFKAADIVVLPYVEFYGQSGVLHLAQGFGKAVIVTDVGGLPEAVENYRSGMIVRAGDEASLVQAIRYLLGNEMLRLEMGRRARENAMDRFSWESVAKATIEKGYT